MKKHCGTLSCLYQPRSSEGYSDYAFKAPCCVYAVLSTEFLPGRPPANGSTICGFAKAVLPWALITSFTGIAETN
jgi:hypothetical protein